MIRSIVRLSAIVLAVATAPPLDAQLTHDISEELMDEMRWRSIGPANMGGRVSDVEGIPSPSKTFYVAAAAGGVWKTTNNGITFKSLFNSERVVAMGDLAIDPNNTDIIWVGTGEEDSRNSISAGGGIYKSIDGGETWELKGLEETQVIARIIVDPIDGNTVYVAALGHIWGANDERGLYRTRDGGESWELVKHISDKAGFVDVVMHPQNPDVLFAAAWERVRGPYFLQSGGPGSGLWKTTDGGDRWVEIEGGGFPTTQKGRIGLAISLSNPEVMYAMVEAQEEEDGSGGNGLYRSSDGGMTWEKKSDINTRPFYYSQVRVDPQDPDRVYFSSTPVQVSNDGGETVGTTTNQVHVDHHAMWIDPNDPDRIIVGNDGGVAISWDRGGNWRYLNQMAMGQPYSVSYNMDYPYRVCGGMQDNGTWCAPSRVTGQISSYHWATISGGDGFVTAQDPEDPDIVFAESQGGNMSRINLRTGSRSTLRKPGAEERIRTIKDSIAVHTNEEGEPNSGMDDQVSAWESQVRVLVETYDLRWNWNTPFFISPHDRFTFYTAANRVMRSTERGDNLQIISPDLTYADPEKIRVASQTTGGITPDVTGAETFATIVALAESPIMRGLLYAGTDDGRVWVSRNDGGTWLEVTDRFPALAEGSYVSRIEPSHHHVDRFYVTFDDHRRGNFLPYVYTTDDGGEHFRSIASDLPSGMVDFVHVVREDPHNENLLFVGTDVGAYVSTDRGGHWQKFMNGLPTVPVHDLQIHPRERELIAATHGRSFWIANIQPLEELTDVTMAEAVVLFQPTHMGMWGMAARGGESTAQASFQRPTPNMGGSISYYLAEDLPRPERPESAEPESAEEDAGVEGEEAEAGVEVEEADTRVGRGAGRNPGRGGPPGGGGRERGRGFNDGPQLEITITDARGQVVRRLQGPGTAGLHTVSWNFRAEGAPVAMASGKSPSQVRDSIKVAKRAQVVIDSLVAEGDDEAEVSRIIDALVTGNTAALGFGRGGRGFGRGGGGGGGGGGGRDPEAFRERPGENFGGGEGRAGNPNFNQLRRYVGLLYPGQSGGLGRIFRRGRGRTGNGNQGALVEPGAYTVTVEVNGQMFSRTMSVRRMDSFGGAGGFGFEDDEDSSWAEVLEWLREGGD